MGCVPDTGRFGFVEMRTEELATSGMQLDKVSHALPPAHAVRRLLPVYWLQQAKAAALICSLQSATPCNDDGRHGR